MGASVYTSLMLKDFKRKKGEIKALRKELRELCKVVQTKEKELAALETLLRTKVPNFDPENIKAIATCPKVTGLKWSSITKGILSCLREAGAPVRTNEITDYVIEATGYQVNTRHDLTVMRTSIRNRLKAMRRDGRVVRHYDDKETRFGTWSLGQNGSGS